MRYKQWSYRGMLYFVYMCSIQCLDLSFIWSIFHYDLQLHCNYSYNLIKTATLVYLEIIGQELFIKKTGYFITTTTTEKIFEKNQSFHVRTAGKVQFLFTGSIFLVLTKFYFWEEYWALGYISMKFWHYSKLS